MTTSYLSQVKQQTNKLVNVRRLSKLLLVTIKLGTSNNIQYSMTGKGQSWLWPTISNN